MPKKAKNNEQGTKQKILSAAFDLFAQRGMKDISMREIAQACGVTKPVIYYYFKDKEALCLEIVRDFEQTQNAKLAQLVKDNPDFGTFLEKLFKSYADNAANKKMVAFMMHLHSYALSNRQAGKILEKRAHGGKKDQLDALLRGIAQKNAIPAGKADIAKHMITANIMHMVFSGQHRNIKFKPSYTSDIAKAVLRAIEYKEDVK